MSLSSKSHHLSPQTTGLEEFLQSRGGASQNLSTLRDAREVLVGEASSSVPNASAYEIMCAVNHVREATGRVRTFIFPTAPIGKVIEGTPLRPTLSQKKNGPTQLTLTLGGHERGSVPFGPDPKNRMANLVARSMERHMDKNGPERVRNMADQLGIEDRGNLPGELGKAALVDRRVTELLTEDELRRVNNYLLKLPTGLFETSDGTPYVEHVVRQRLRYVMELGELLLDEKDRRKLPNFSVESIEPYLGDLTLSDLRRQVGDSYDTKIALSYDCPECGIDTPESVIHSITFDGQTQMKFGSNKPAKKQPLRGCKMLKDRAETQFSTEQINRTPVRELIAGGFTLSGTGIYAALSLIFAEGDTTLGVANYKPARGTVNTISKIWQGPMYITTRARIYHRDGHIATYPELQSWLETSPEARDRFRQFVRSIPVIASGPELRFEIE